MMPIKNIDLKPTIFVLLFLLGNFTMGLLSGYSQETDVLRAYDHLFDSVQLNQVFKDQKKFVDCTPKLNYTPDEILKKYNELSKSDTFNLSAFVSHYFDTLFIDTTAVIEHINYLWDYLSRQPATSQGYSTLIPLKYPYIVPGGRFREIYYWDSYFTMLGLEEAGKYSMIKNMLDNFAFLIETYGYIPNGNRTYYLGRSQPPFFALMIELYAGIAGDSVYLQYCDALEKEYNFWMRGMENVREPHVMKEKYRIVRLNGNEIMNRYWDNTATPRPESFLYDVQTKQESGRDTTIYRDLRAAAESGWDFSSRWLVDGYNLNTIQTTDIIPIDLNCLLYQMEMTLSKAESFRDPERSNEFRRMAEERKRLVNTYFWNEKQGFFFDYNYKQGSQTEIYSLAALYPLFFNMVDTNTAMRVADIVEKEFLQLGGLVTTLHETGQQWDCPNGWPPLQWIGYKAFKNYGREDLANEIARRWINLNVKVFFETHKMMEKYDVKDIHKYGGGGEYPLQDGFGWTNGVFLKLWNDIHEISNY